MSGRSGGRGRDRGTRGGPDRLRREGFVATGFPDAVDADLILAGSPDLAVLDIALPGGSGFSLGRTLRARSTVSIIFLTARDAGADRVQGLELGADDYLVKPSRWKELLARTRAVLRRYGRVPAVLEAGDLTLDEAQARVTRAGAPVALTTTELAAARVLDAPPRPGSVQGPAPHPGMGL